MITINATNAAGRDPAAMLRAALDKGAEELEVLTDSTATAMSIKQQLEKRGFQVQIEDDDGRLKLIAAKGSPQQRQSQPMLVPQAQPRAQAPGAPRPLPVLQAGQPDKPRPDKPDGEKPDGREPDKKEEPRLAVLITGPTLGRGNDELGEILIRNFLGVLAGTPPAAVVLMNGGVQLALFDSSACDRLKDAERRGAKVLVSGTCAAHFGITESVGVGSLASMPEIFETLSGADKILTL